jgi:hypothetical protein
MSTWKCYQCYSCTLYMNREPLLWSFINKHDAPCSTGRVHAQTGNKTKKSVSEAHMAGGRSTKDEEHSQGRLPKPEDSLARVVDDVVAGLEDALQVGLAEVLEEIVTMNDVVHSGEVDRGRTEVQRLEAHMYQLLRSSPSLTIAIRVVNSRIKSM